MFKFNYLLEVECNYFETVLKNEEKGTKKLNGTITRFKWCFNFM